MTHSATKISLVYVGRSDHKVYCALDPQKVCWLIEEAEAERIKQNFLNHTGHKAEELEIVDNPGGSCILGYKYLDKPAWALAVPTSVQLNQEIKDFELDVIQRFIKRTALGDMMTQNDKTRHHQLIEELIEAMRKEGKL